MLLASVNFALYYRIFTGRLREVAGDSEFRAFIIVVLSSIAIVTLLENNASTAFSQTVRNVAFQASSIVSTTGFMTADYTKWCPPAQVVILLLFFIGGCSGSTAGGVKVIRWTILAKEIGDEIGKPSYIVDPVVVDELQDIARISGVPELPRVSIFHALNQKAVAKRYAKETGKKYEDLNLIVVHMGGGVSVGAHTDGKVVDVFNALSGDGAFSPERAGAVPPGALVDMCFSGKYTQKEIMKKLIGNGGFNAYLGTNDAREVAKMALEEGNENAKTVFDAFICQVSKDIGAQAAVLRGKVDQIILTGGIAYGKYVTEEIIDRVKFIAPVTVYAGEDELLALAQGALRVLNGEEEAKEY